MHWLHSIQILVSGWGMFGAFLVMVVENLGIPLPTEIGFIIAQNQVAKGEITYIYAVLVITFGHVVGAILGYAIGRWGDKKTRRFFERNEKLQNAKIRIKEWYDKWGIITILFTRNFGYVRPWSSLIAGFAQMPFWPFLIWTIIGSFIFSFISLTITKYLLVIWQNYPETHIIISIAAGFLFFGLIAFELGKKIYEKFSRHTR
ncbi:MAG: DedA family protein [Patescibacteria group bacterium]|jgi:membrane protein DedA with SNARE-associated domain